MPRALFKLDEGVRYLVEPINQWVLCKNRIHAWVTKNAYTVLFLAVFGWLALLTLAVIHNG